MTEVRFYNNVDDNLLKFAVIISKSVLNEILSSISLLKILQKICYTLARTGSRSCLTSKVHSA